MGIRIDHIPYGAKHVVRISGRLTRHSVVQLEKACQPIEAHCVVDLSGLLYADEEGVNAIRALIQSGVQIRGASPFIVLLLNNGLGRPTGIEL